MLVHKLVILKDYLQIIDFIVYSHYNWYVIIGIVAKITRIKKIVLISRIMIDGWTFDCKKI